MVKRIIPILLVGILIMTSSCEKQEFPVSTPPVAVFKMEGSLNGEPWSYAVGLDNSFLETYTGQDFPGRDVLSADLIQLDCPDCESLVSFTITGHGSALEDQPEVDPESLLEPFSDFDLSWIENQVLLSGEFSEALENDWEVFVNGSQIASSWELLDWVNPGDELDIEISRATDTGGFMTWNIYSTEQPEFECGQESRLIAPPHVGLDSEGIFNVEIPEDIGDFDYVELLIGEFEPENYILFPGQELEIEVEPEFVFTGMVEFLYYDAAQPAEPVMAMNLLILPFPEMQMDSPALELVSFREMDMPLAAISLSVNDDWYQSAPECWLPWQNQPEDGHFTIISNEEYEANQDGQATRKVTIEADLMLYHADDPSLEPLHLIIEEGVIAFAMPD